MEGRALSVMAGGPLPRHAYLDNLKVVLVVGVIVGHVLITYADVGTWAYRETSVNDAFLIPAALIVALGSLFAMGVFFLIAGLMTPGPLARKGPGGFLRDRSLRLGVPVMSSCSCSTRRSSGWGSGAASPSISSCASRSPTSIPGRCGSCSRC